MKIRNKKTGRIFAVGDDIFICNDILGKIKLYWRTNGEDVIAFYDDLLQFNEDWEDYEPKEFWYIVQDGDIFSGNNTVTEDYANRLQIIGNYFESIEEAKKAVEKLKAWKRLKDKGFRFEGWNWKAQSIDYSLDYTAITEEQSEEVDKDIDLLFGGEE